MITGVLSVGVNQLLTNKPKTPEEIFWHAVGQCRKQALLSSQDVSLVFSSKEKTAALNATWRAGMSNFPFENAAELKVDFLGVQKGGSAILLGGQLVETKTIPSVTFFADGTCTPFRAQFKSPGTEARVLEIDPWTCAAVLPAADKP